MAQDINRVILGGRIVMDPEYHEFDNGGAVFKARIACNGRRDEDTVFKNINLYQSKPVEGKRGRAQVAYEYLKKGSKLIVEGNLAQREVEKDGNKRTFEDVRVSDWYFGDSKAAAGGNANATTLPTPAKADDLPF